MPRYREPDPDPEDMATWAAEFEGAFSYEDPPPPDNVPLKMVRWMAECSPGRWVKITRPYKNAQTTSSNFRADLGPRFQVVYRREGGNSVRGNGPRDPGGLVYVRYLGEEDPS